MDFLTWLGGVEPSAVINALGLGSLAVLFATDRIKTRGQANRELAQRDQAHAALVAALKDAHAQIVAALVANHADALAQRDERNNELKTSLGKMEEARNVERDRADSATAMLGRAVDAVEVSNHLLESLGEAADKEGRK